MHTKRQESISGLRDDMVDSLKSASAVASQEHQTTREDIRILRKQVEDQAEQLKAELEVSKSDLENAINETVGSSVQANQMVQKKLQQSKNVQYSLWAAKEAMLKSVLPTKSPNVSTQSSSSSKQVELWYPIVARNVPMFKRCLGNGADVNAMYQPDMDWQRASPLLEMPPLILALLLSHEHRQAIVELLLEYGADPTATDNGGTSVFKYALKSEDQALIEIVVSAPYERDKNSEHPPKLLSADRKNRQED
ncbi:hypothetical protein P154DRAFT_531328 [Amniculicola lignicola CBS 123094]|uniref:Uncharacterized protein n=1 Tax=Amniculicola lignicola CBS 123094 TaxID=1392246 RepID=A0A6A5X224_9PLEO|nr:hypothetical protein P154DRAFT_531328 [Amniculicola lignicola CBS 123094]